VYNSCFDNIFIGKYITYLPTCHSTNDIASELVQKGLAEEGHIVITDFQTAGRGQRGAAWESTRGLNLTFSVCLQPDFLLVDEQFYLSMAFSLGIKDFLSSYTEDVSIKWPNDLYVGNKKCCGILIENAIAGLALKKSIVGIGLNINQQTFENPKATSLAEITQTTYDLKELLPALLTQLEKYYVQLKNGKKDQIRHGYIQAMYGFGQERKFRDASGEFTGIIEGISNSGMLIINKTNSHRTEYAMKEIQWL